jgi:Yip1 domain
VVVFSQHIGWDQVIRKSLDQGNQNMTAEQRQQAVALLSRVLPLAGYLAPIGAAFVIVLMSAVLIFLTNIVMGADIRFPSMLGVVGYSGIPPALVVTALTILVMFLKSPEDFDINNPLAFNVGAFLPDGTAKWLVSLGGSMDLFSFWRIGLLAGGLSAASPKLTFGKALFVVVFPWALYVAGKTAIAAISR